MSLALLLTLVTATPFDAYMATEGPVADGFDFPVGDVDAKGWYRATKTGDVYPLGIHTGEDWNGKGGGDTDFGDPVYSIGAGRVVYAEMAPNPWGGVVMIDHVYYENHEKKRVRSQYAHLSKIHVKVGDDVTRRQHIGAVGKDPAGTYYAHLHLELRTDRTLSATYWPSSNGKDLAWVKKRYLDPTAFIRAHRELFVPHDEKVLLLVDHETHAMTRYEKGELVEQLEVGFGQAKGRKRRQGDLKTPKGMYFVVNKHRGAFSGRWAAYYGGHWIKVNYPNKYDAEWGVANGIVSRKTADRIAKKWRRRKLPTQKTKLGGGIGFHGWAGPWRLEDGGMLSWGCIVMHNEDIKRVFDDVPTGAMVVIR